MRSLVIDDKTRLKIQPVIGLLLIFTALFIFNYLRVQPVPALASNWLFGLSVGFILQRSRICFTAAARDPFLFGMTGLTRAILIALMITSVGYYGFQYYQSVQGVSISGNFVPLGWHIPIGAFIFGLGASISGGCASGTLVRLGEGFQLQIIVLIGFIIGSVHGAHDASFWYNLFEIESRKFLHLPSLIGWIPALVIQLIILGLLYHLSYFREKNEFSK
ncbi:MAG: YeeE/YedE family protein [Firmicutes bacterium]|nr:YeeE/YedE family protein [Bacillota bacterium]